MSCRCGPPTPRTSAANATSQRRLQRARNPGSRLRRNLEEGDVRVGQIVRRRAPLQARHTERAKTMSATTPSPRRSGWSIVTSAIRRQPPATRAPSSSRKSPVRQFAASKRRKSEASRARTAAQIRRALARTDVATQRAAFGPAQTDDARQRKLRRTTDRARSTRCNRSARQGRPTRDRRSRRDRTNPRSPAAPFRAAARRRPCAASSLDRMLPVSSRSATARREPRCSAAGVIEPPAMRMQRSSRGRGTEPVGERFACRREQRPLAADAHRGRGVEDRGQR